jgi:sulfur carrier protein
MSQGTRVALEDTLVIIVNGEHRQVAAATLDDLLVRLGYADQKVATAVNGDFVAARARNTTWLRPGDEIEIVAPRQGG